MIIFEELVYQEAVRRKLTIPPAKLNQAEAEFRKQFQSPDEYQQYMQTEMHGSRASAAAADQRSLLIEEMLKAEVDRQVRSHAGRGASLLRQESEALCRPESRSHSRAFRSCRRRSRRRRSVEKKRRNAPKMRCARPKRPRAIEEFGLLAEKISEDDFRVNMGDHKAVGADKLPPQIVKAAQAMQAGQISGLIQIGNAFTIFRLNAHNPARKQPFAEVKRRPAHGIGQEQVRTAALESGETTPG